MLDFTSIKMDEHATAKAAHDLLQNNWHNAIPLGDVSLPQSDLLEDLALLASIKVSNYWFSQKVRLRGTDSQVKGLLRAYLATVIGSDGIA